MISIFSVIFYILLFLSVYIQMFFLITFIENRKKIINRKNTIILNSYPEVTIIVPGFNEENTIEKTVKSLLQLNYPKDKLKIFLIDDGSTDKTLDIMNKFIVYPNIKVFHQKNGGKHTALNFGLENTDSPFVGCLDADSMVHEESLVRIMSYFENNPNIMATAPSIIVTSPKGIIQNAQKAEYYMSVYVKKMLGFLGGIHVTPGPFTIFRKKVFDDLGPYHHAHNTEDMEIAYRMQKNYYKIDQCNDAYVYTNTPNTVKKLYKQRLRWIYGFINNTIDYRNIIFRKKYGNFSLLTVPAGIISIFAASYLFGKTLYEIVNFLFSKIVEYKTAGFFAGSKIPTIDFFFVNTQSFVLYVTIVLYFLVILSIVLGRKISQDKWGLSMDMIYFFFIYSVIAPFWLMNAVYNTIRSKRPAWR